MERTVFPQCIMTILTVVKTNRVLTNIPKNGCPFAFIINCNVLLNVKQRGIWYEVQTVSVRLEIQRKYFIEKKILILQYILLSAFKSYYLSP